MPDEPLDQQPESIARATTDSRAAVESASRQLEPAVSNVRMRSTRNTSIALQVASLALLLAVVAVVVAGRQVAQHAPQTTSQVTTSVTLEPAGGTPTPTTTLSGAPIGALPTTCGASPTFPTVGPPDGDNAVGSDPVWVDGFEGATATIDIAQRVTGPYMTHGWPVLIVLAYTLPFSAKVALDGESLPAQKPLWFSFQGPNGGTPPSVGFTMDPQQQSDLYPSGDSTANFWFGSLFLPGAGCYALDAHWNGGSWRAIFAAGQ